MGIPNYNGLYMFQNAGGARVSQKAGTNEDLLLSCEIDLGRQVDVPAACDIFYSTSRAVFMSFYRRCIFMTPSASPSASTGPRFKVMLGFFTSKSQQGNHSLLKTLRHFLLLMPQQSLELIAEFISLLRTHYQGSLGVQV